MQDTFITAAQLARMLNLSRGTVYVMRKKGILPEGRKLGSARRWSMAELNEFLKGGVADEA